MDFFLILVLLFVCLGLVMYYFKRPNNIFMAPGILSLITLFQIWIPLVQVMNIAHIELKYFGLYTIIVILSLLSFHIGFQKGKKNSERMDFKIRDLDLSKNLLYAIGFTLCGVIALMIYKYNYWGFDFVIAGVFQTMGIIAMMMSFSYLVNHPWKKSWLYVILIMVSFWCVWEYAFNVKGSRTRVFYLLVLTGYFMYLKYPKISKKISTAFIISFAVGAIASASMGDYRRELRTGRDTNAFGFENVVSNFKEQFNRPLSRYKNGFDVYNGMEYVGYTWERGEYNYGTSIWNGIVFNFVPRRAFGAETKDKLMSPLERRDVVNSLTHGVTTVTGYGEAFACFSIFGIFIFGFIAYWMGKWWNRALYSSYYKVLYGYAIMYMAPMITHGLTYFTSPIFLWFVFFSLLFLPTSKKINVKPRTIS